MKKKILIIVSAITLIIIVLVGFIGFGLYSMEIEDHYGDLQTTFYNSKNGDLIVNEETKKFGILKKEWKTIKVIEKNNKETDLYNWVYINGKVTKFKIFRLETETDLITEMEYPEIQEKIRLEKLKQIED